MPKQNLLAQMFLYRAEIIQASEVQHPVLIVAEQQIIK